MHALEAKPKQRNKKQEKERKPRVPVVFGPGGNNIGVFFGFWTLGLFYFKALGGCNKARF